MRISGNSEDKNYFAAKGLKVFLNDQPIACLEADTEEGYVKIYPRTPNHLIILDKDDNPYVVRLEGDVRIEHLNAGGETVSHTADGITVAGVAVEAQFLCIQVP